MNKIIFIITALIILSCANENNNNQKANGLTVKNKKQIKELREKLSEPKLSEQLVENYTKAMFLLTDKFPEALDRINEDKDMKRYPKINELEKVLKKYGFSTKSFSKTHKKIATIYSYVLGYNSIGQLGYEQFRQELERLKKLYNSPGTSQQQKEIYKKMIKQLEVAVKQAQIAENGKKWKEKTKKAKERFINEVIKEILTIEEFNLVKKYSETLSKVYDSGYMPKIITPENY